MTTTNSLSQPASYRQLDFSVFESTPGLRFALLPDSPAFTIAAASTDLCRHLELSRELLVGTSLFNASAGDGNGSVRSDNQKILESLQEVVQHKTPRELKQICFDQRPAGSHSKPRYWDILITPVVTGGGIITHVIQTLEDVTSQVLARMKRPDGSELEQTYGRLQESEDRYRSLIDSIDQGFCVIEIIFDEQQHPIDYLFIEVNSQFEHHTGLKDCIGKQMRELLPDQDEHWFHIYGEVALTGNPIRFQEGSTALGRWFDVYAFRVGGDGSTEVAVLFSDISQRKMGEVELKEKDENLRNIIHHAPVAMFIFRGSNLVIETANALALEMIERSDSVVGKPLLEVLPELNEQPAYEVFQSVYRTGIPQYGLEVLVPLERHGTIEERYFNFAYTPLREKGQVVGVMDVATEVTELVLARKKIEQVVTHRTKELAEANEALQLSNKELQRSNAYLEEFAHAASHDLKEPIRKIHYFTERLRIGLVDKLTPDDERMFSRVQHASQRMNALIDDLLLYSHVTQKPHEKETINLNDKIKKILEDLEVLIEDKQALINVQELPTVLGYRRQLQQLFQNLMTNALKYSRTDARPEILIYASLVNGAEAGLPADVRYHKITVRDNGIGFEQDQAEKIFQMFQRLHGKSEYQGTGVGLSIARKVVENHDGKITAESIPGKGSSFHVYLPVA